MTRDPRQTPVAGLRVAPVEATEAMVDVGALNNPTSRYPRTHSANIYAAMIAAAPCEFTDEQIDALCRLMWRDTVSPPEHYSVTREQRARMRAFLVAVNGAPE
jgi:hypothetical protein